MGGAITPRRIGPAVAWRAGCAGVPSGTACVWATLATAPARPRAWVVHPTGTSLWAARVMGMPPWTNRRPRARVIPWDARG